MDLQAKLDRILEASAYQDFVKKECAECKKNGEKPDFKTIGKKWGEEKASKEAEQKKSEVTNKESAKRPPSDAELTKWRVEVKKQGKENEKSLNKALKMVKDLTSEDQPDEDSFIMIQDITKALKSLKGYI